MFQTMALERERECSRLELEIVIAFRRVREAVALAGALANSNEPEDIVKRLPFGRVVRPRYDMPEEPEAFLEDFGPWERKELDAFRAECDEVIGGTLRRFSQFVKSKSPPQTGLCRRLRDGVDRACCEFWRRLMQCSAGDRA